MNLKIINGFEDYSISDCGKVKSIERKVLRISPLGLMHEKTVRERILKPAVAGNGYLFVCLRKNNRHYNQRIHILVAEHFIGLRPKGLIINHINGDSLDNRVENLEYCSKSKNTQVYFNTLGKCFGKVPIEDIPLIIEQIRTGTQIEAIALKYGVRRNDIAVINKIISLTGKELELKKENA